MRQSARGQPRPPDRPRRDVPAPGDRRRAHARRVGADLRRRAPRVRGVRVVHRGPAAPRPALPPEARAGAAGPGPPVVGRRPALQRRATTCATARCPRPGSDEQLRNLAGRLFAQPLDRAKPLWEINLVEGLDGRGPLRAHLQDPPRARRRRQRRRHHLGALRHLARPGARRRAEDGVWAPQPEPPPPSTSRRALLERATMPGEAVRGVRALTRGPRQTLAKVGERLVGVGAMAWAGTSPAPRTSLNVPIGPHRRYAWVDGEVATLKAVKNALRRHAQRRDPDRRRDRPRALPARPRRGDRRRRAQGDGAGVRARRRGARRAGQPGRRDVGAAAGGRRGPAGGLRARSTRRWPTSRSPARPSARRCSPRWPTSRPRRSSARPRACRPASATSTSS